VIVALAISCAAIDGDTIRCGSERIRLTAIDAPEFPGHCRRGRDCAPGDPLVSKAALSLGLAAKTLTIERLGTDRYGRTVADVYRNGISLSCVQLQGGWARYWPKYDKGQRIKKECGL
jgi:endonuclease YncB( thermonuclease family)